MNEYNGILPLYKPRGMTSHDCVFRLRKLLHFKKIGHTGTLDPQVDGVLVLCLGRATRVAEFLLDYGKTYQGVIALGTATTTEDASGEITAEQVVEEPIRRTAVETVLASMRGPIEQITPLYSAVKVNGRKLYEYARAGIPVEPPIRHVTIYDLKLLNPIPNYKEQIAFEVSCSKGTYVRTLAKDIGSKLGYPAHLQTLTRIKAGPFPVEACFTFAQIESLVEKDTFQEALRPLEQALSQMEKWTVDGMIEEQIRHGAVLPLPESFDDRPHAVYNSKGQCLAIYQIHPEHSDRIKPVKVLI
ncbi:tRNA pseudouridine(55) synthase TruB [Sporolactobacillus spathodeae]|uniref:tRNA pseudouridine synthase B n=1 Tax=Sporolactobacillus spathodeae TaxID=1465502 RepID=A0ABS2Q5D4_9BACL|nr:tRNA pseudouridine(55) synthase TruB [Sporolactobacillus spathodeae]MBM7656991.1 tRNA pseudouridine55 synthase [Sporolactobacillus spathodeae]